MCGISSVCILSPLFSFSSKSGENANIDIFAKFFEDYFVRTRLFTTRNHNVPQGYHNVPQGIGIFLPQEYPRDTKRNYEISQGTQ
jgi:hypothetical protein